MNATRLSRVILGAALLAIAACGSAPAPPGQDGPAPPGGSGAAAAPGGSNTAAAPGGSRAAASAGEAPTTSMPASPPADVLTSRDVAEAPVTVPAAAPADLPRADASAAADLRAQVASWRKVRYRDNGTTRKGIGNAGFARALVKAAFGVDIPARTDAQMRTGKLVELKALEPGDLVFFDGKGVGPFRARSVGVFIGRGEVALATKDLGVAIVRLSDARWREAFNTARRVSGRRSKEAPSFDAADYGSNRAALLRDVAKAWVGTLYKQGGTTFEGIGNDEFVRSIYEAINDDELGGAPQQWAKMGRGVKRADLQPGDIILYEAVGIGKLLDRRHAGMYIGDGEFVHAVKGSAVTISRLNEARWAKAYRAARRIEPDLEDGAPASPAAAAGSRAGSAPAARRSAAPAALARTVTEPERRLRDAAQPWLGTPYKLGGNTKSGVDCSAFVKAVYNDVYGVELPRTAEEQERLGTKVARQDLQPGDLVFFRTKGMGPFFRSRHVGVYLGGGEFAQASGRLGVNISPLSNRYWSKKYESARRLTTTSTR